MTWSFYTRKQENHGIRADVRIMSEEKILLQSGGYAIPADQENPSDMACLHVSKFLVLVHHDSSVLIIYFQVFSPSLAHPKG